MHANKRALFLNALWLAVPSVVWSVVFHSLTLCADPFILQALDRRLPMSWSLLLRTAWAVLFVVPLLYIWNIPPGTYLFFLREALPFSPPSVLVSVSVAVVCLLWFILHRGFEKTSRAASRSLLVLGVLILVLKFFVVLGAGNANEFQKRLKSPAMTAAGIWHETASLRAGASDVATTPERTFNSFIRARKLPRKVVLMAVESWDETPEGLAQIGAQMRSAGFTVLESGYTVYRGSTLSGEIRELCSEYTALTNGLVVKDDFDCAPRYLTQAGYKTLGVHAYDGAFYARKTFWKRFGLEDRWFSEKFAGANECPGPFRAACDEDIIHGGMAWLESDTSSRFLYLLTLSSHEAIEPAALARPAGKFFSDIPVVHPTQQVARRAVSSLLVELQRARPGECMLAYAVGDHAPPSASPTMFPPHKVPFIAFESNCFAD